MKTFSAVIVLAAVLVVPATAVAKPDASDKRAAIAQCKAERGKSKATRRAFKAKYHSFSRCIHHQRVHVATQCKAEGAAKHGKKAFRECVSEKASAFKNAAKECRSEADDDAFEASHDDTSFEDFYGTNRNHRNAFGKCVSSKAGEDHYVDPFDEDEHGHKHEHPDSDQR